jgi:hypothetical protein
MLSLFSAEFTEAGAKRWRSNNFRLGQITETLASTFDGVSGVECPDDLSGATQTICAVAINVLQVVSLTARDLSRQVSRASRGVAVGSMFCRCWNVAVSNFFFATSSSFGAKSTRHMTFLLTFTTKLLVPAKFKTKR